MRLRSNCEDCGRADGPVFDVRTSINIAEGVCTFEPMRVYMSEEDQRWLLSNGKTVSIVCPRCQRERKRR